MGPSLGTLCSGTKVPEVCFPLIPGATRLHWLLDLPVQGLELTLDTKKQQN